MDRNPAEKPKRNKSGILGFANSVLEEKGVDAVGIKVLDKELAIPNKVHASQQQHSHHMLLF